MRMRVLVYVKMISSITIVSSCSVEDFTNEKRYCNLHFKFFTGSVSIWPYLPSLISLSLSYTAVKKPCPEWLEAMPSLKHIYLNLSHSEQPWVWTVSFFMLDFSLRLEFFFFIITISTCHFFYFFISLLF